MSEDFCDYPLLYDEELDGCDLPDVVNCNEGTSPPPGTGNTPPPPPPETNRNYTTGLDLDSTKAEIRFGNQTYLSNVSRYFTVEESTLPSSVDWSYLFGDSVRSQGSCSKWKSIIPLVKLTTLIDFLTFQMEVGHIL